MSFFVASLALIACLFNPTGGQSDKLLKAKGLVEAINSLDQAKIEAFISTSFSAKVDVKAHPKDFASKLLAIGKQVAPFRLGKTIEDKESTLVVRLEGRQARELEMWLDFDPEDQGILSVRIGGPGSQSGPEPKHYTIWKDLPDLLTQIKADNQIPAVCAGIVKDGVRQSAVVGERQVGKLEKVQIGDRWLIGSVGKSMTATMIARLIDEGLLRWDTTIGEALPDVPMRPEYKAVTIFQLLRHRAGIPEDLTVDDAFLKKVVGKSTERVEMRAKYARFTLSREPIAKPDEKTLYSNAGYSLAGHIAEVVAKKPYEQLMREKLFEPLHMDSAQIGVPGTDGNPGGKGQIMGHYPGAGKPEPGVLADPRINALFAPAGLGVNMSIDDLLKFAEYHLKGLRGEVSLLKPESFRKLHETAGEPPYACGWVTSSQFVSEPSIGHNGSDGTFRAEVAIWPDRNLAVVSIMNVGNTREPGPPLQVVIAAFDRYARGALKRPGR